MIIDKYILWFRRANEVAARRLSMPPLSDHQLTVLMLVKRGKLVKLSVVMSHMEKLGKISADFYCSLSLKHLVKHGLVSKESVWHSITPKGREYLSYIRHFLLNKRL
jgi:hypothetical protein